MNNLLLLAIPVAVGVATGVFMAVQYDQRDGPVDVVRFTASALTDGGSPVMGATDAGITILEWGDYQCTYCYMFHDTTLNHIIENYVDAGEVRIVFKDFPLNGPDSLLAAEASHCAGDQGLYWKYHDELYGNWGGERTGWITRGSLSEFAHSAGLDATVFEGCMDAQKYREKVELLYREGQNLGIDATPSFLIFNDTSMVKIRGNQPLDVFVMAIEGL